MSKANAIRTVMSTTKDMAAADIAKACGLTPQQVCTFLTCAEQRRNEVISSGERPHQRYRLNPDYKPSRASPGEGKRVQRKRGKNAPKEKPVKKTIAQIADKMATAPKRDQLAVRHYIAAGKNLRAVIRDVVEDMDECEQLVAALDLHETAEQMVAA